MLVQLLHPKVSSLPNHEQYYTTHYRWLRQVTKYLFLTNAITYSDQKMVFKITDATELRRLWNTALGSYGHQ